MTNRTSLAAALATASILVLSAQAAHAGVPMPPRPIISIQPVKPSIPVVKPHIPVTNPGAPVFHCKCGGHPPIPTVNNNYPYGHKPQPIVKPPVKLPVTTTVTSTSSHPGSFGGKPATLNTTNSNWQGPAGSGTQTTTVITDSSGHVIGAISSAALNQPSATSKPQPVATPAPATTAPQPTVHQAPATTAPQPAVHQAPATQPAANSPSAPQPGTVPVHTSTPAPAPAANAPAPTHTAAPAAAAPASPPAHATPPAASPAPAAAPKKPEVWKPVLYPGFTDQYKAPKGYYVDGKLVMGFKGPSGTMCTPTIGFSTIGSGTVSSTSSPGMIQVPAVLCYVKS